MTRAWDMASLMSNSSFGKIPSGTTANRPASPAVGDQYYNGTLGYLEIYTSSGWKPAGGIPSGNTAGRPSSPSTGQPYFNGELQRLELYTGAQYGWQNIVAETPGVTGYSGTVIETNTTNTITITGTNFATGAVVVLVGQDGTEISATSVTISSSTSISATFGVIPANNEPYDIRVTNPSNLYGVYYDILSVNDKAVWTTAAGSLGTVYTGQSISIQLVASDEENNALTYSLASGSLPTGLTLSSSGLISGTPSGTTSQTFNFTISVSDGINTAQSRNFSIVYTSVAAVTGGTLTSDATYYYRTFTGNGNLVVSNIPIAIDSLIVAGGGSGGSSAGGGGGGGGMVIHSTTLSTATYPITVGAGGPASFANGVDSTFNGKTAIGGGGGASMAGPSPGNSGGSGGGGQRLATSNDQQGSPGGAGLQPGSASGGYGNAGGYGRDYSGSNAAGGGGGGAGAVGSNGISGGTGGAGGNGFYTSLTNAIGAATSTGQLSGGNYYYAGGGGGGCGGDRTSSNTTGGLGGGGYGSRGMLSSSDTTAIGQNGFSSTGGGGGGGGSFPGGGNPGGNGGSGVVVVRYLRSAVGG